MIVSRPGRESRFHRQRLSRRADRIDFATADESKTAFACGQAAKQTDESRGEQCETDRPSNRPFPLRDQIAPQIRQDNEVSPDQDFEIVPDPRRRLEAESENKNYGRAENEGDFFRQFASPPKSFLPNAVAKNSDEGQDQRNQDSKVIEPKSKKRHGELAASFAALGPTQMKLHHPAGMKMIGD